MNIVCSKCQSRYRIPDEKIPENGCYVRCQKCDNKIFIPSPNRDLAVKNNNDHVDTANNMEDTSVTCPRCHTKQMPRAECHFCGLVFHKYFTEEQKKKREEAEAQKRKFGKIGVTEEQFSAFVGPNSDYYVRTFNSFFINFEDSYSANWNWCSFLCGPYWFLYRRMYLHGFLTMGILPITYFVFPFAFLFAIFFGMFGNYWYYKFAKRNISSALLSMPSSEKPEFKEDVLAALSHIGGVDPAFKVIGFIALGCICFFIFFLFFFLITSRTFFM